MFSSLKPTPPPSGNHKKGILTTPSSNNTTTTTIKNNSRGGGADISTAKQRSQHRSLITLVHGKTLFLAKTVQKYPRKHRDLSNNGVLLDAVEALEEFKDVEWPPKRVEMDEILDSVPSWLGGDDGERVDGEGESSTSSSNVKVVESAEKNEEETPNDMPEEKDVAKTDESSVSVSSENNGEKDDETSADASTTDTMQALEKELENANIDDEEEAEKLHQEVLHAGKNEEGDGGDNTDEGDKLGDSSKENDNIDTSAQEKSVPPPPPVQTDGDSIVDEEQGTEKGTPKRLRSIVDQENPMETPQAPQMNNVKSSKSTKQQSKKQPPSVDAAAMEPMHPAVITTLHALCMVISSESNTPKMAETALECITILTNGRYVSGVAGGRMKLEVQRKMSRDNINTGQQQQQGSGGDNSNNPSSGVVMGVHNGIQLRGHDGRDGGLSFLGYVVESVTRASDSSSEVVQGAMAKALLSIMTCPKCGVHEAAMLQAVRSTFHIYLVGKSVSGKELAKRTLVDMLKCVFMRMEAYDIISKDVNTNNDGEDSNKQESNVGVTIVQSKSGEEMSVSTATTAATNGTEEATTSIGAFASQYHTDSYLLFRALCKLSSKTLPGDENVGMVTMGSTAMAGMSATFFSSTPTVDPLALNSKILSLELILAVFEHCGDAFRYGEKFVYAVQSYLCVSLLKNCMSNQTVVAHLSLKIFLLLVR